MYIICQLTDLTSGSAYIRFHPSPPCVACDSEDGGDHSQLPQGLRVRCRHAGAGPGAAAARCAAAASSIIASN